MNLPKDISKPFFSYGIFRPGEIAFQIISDYVDLNKIENKTIKGSLKLRDGILIFDQNGNDFIQGYLLSFKEGAESSAYESIVNVEPGNYYTWKEDQSKFKNQFNIPEIMQYKLMEMSKSDANEVAAAKSKLSQVRKELNVTEERFATGKIEPSLYNKFSEKFRKEISELEEKLMNPNLTSSNLQKCIKNGFDLSKNLSKIWTSGDLFDKHKLQHFLFPNGFAYDKQNGRVQTFRTNVFFELIRSISTTLSKIKNGDPINFDQISARVTPTGF